MKREVEVALKALSRGAPDDFVKAIEWLETLRRETLDLLEQADSDVVVRQLQGEARAYKRIAKSLGDCLRTKPKAHVQPVSNAPDY